MGRGHGLAAVLRRSGPTECLPRTKAPSVESYKTSSVSSVLKIRIR